MPAHGSFLRWLTPGLLVFLFSAPPLAAETVLVVPFQNTARVADLDWVGESFAEALGGHLAAAGQGLLTRDERLAALERLGLSAAAPLSRASLLRLGEEIGADWVVLGRFEINENRLTAWAQPMDIRSLVLTPWIGSAGPFERLLDVQEELSWKILRRLDPNASLSRIAFQQRSPQLGVSAFESYVRGLLAMSRQQQRRYFLQAVRLQPGYYPPALRLGHLYYEDEDYAAATGWLKQIPLEDPLGAEARFYLSLCYFLEGKYEEATRALVALAERSPSRTLWNNLGVFASRRGQGDAAVEYFARALENRPGDADTLFNLGLHHLRQQNWVAASRALKQSAELNPGDSAAHLLYAQALERLGRAQEAEQERRRAGNPEAGPGPGQDLNQDRLHLHFSAYEHRPGNSSPAAAPARARHVAVHVERGQALLSQGEFERAQEELGEALLLDPASHRAHSLLGEIYKRQGFLDEAIAELKAALWSRDSVEARLRLAEVYLAKGRPQDAREQVQAALALDPDSHDAHALNAQLPIETADTKAEESSVE